ncbi:DoxX family protein [Edwardsiella piscicida]|uniref:DoxX family protein n=1 Tax=Edwardsiella piscicida TaxID=1263550 RepID=UPI00370D9213
MNVFLLRLNHLLHNEDLGKLLLRITLGGLMLFHGVNKAAFGLTGINALLAAKGLPAFLGYGTYVGELLAPALIVLGVLVRPSALIMAFTMLFAWYLVHVGDTFSLTKSGASAIESLLYYGVGGLALACLGTGSYSILKTARWR